MKIKIIDDEGAVLAEPTSKRKFTLHRRGGIRKPVVVSRWLLPTDVYYNPRYHRVVRID
jgi:hypothetical protein